MSKNPTAMEQAVATYISSGILNAPYSNLDELATAVGDMDEEAWEKQYRISTEWVSDKTLEKWYKTITAAIGVGLATTALWHLLVKKNPNEAVTAGLRTSALIMLCRGIVETSKPLPDDNMVARSRELFSAIVQKRVELASNLNTMKSSTINRI